MHFAKKKFRNRFFLSSFFRSLRQDQASGLGEHFSLQFCGPIAGLMPRGSGFESSFPTALLQWEPTIRKPSDAWKRASQEKKLPSLCSMGRNLMCLIGHRAMEQKTNIVGVMWSIKNWIALLKGKFDHLVSLAGVVVVKWEIEFKSPLGDKS